MAPKYKGDEESWLSDERNHKKKAKKQRGFISKKEEEALAWDAGNARVSEVFPNLCRVSADPSDALPSPVDVLCSYRKVGLVGGSDLRERSPVAVGDRVRFEHQGSRGVVTGICARKNALLRAAPGREHKVHAIAANVEALVIVASVKNPDFSSGLIDRFLVSASANQISPIICVTKVDLISPEDPKPWQLYIDLGYSVVEISIRTGSGVKQLIQAIHGKDTVFCGHSGVGKTSLLTHFLGSQVGKIGEVNEVTGKGRHTTSSSIRYPVPSTLSSVPGKGWIDTPGVREFSLSTLDPTDLPQYFPELRAAGCEHRDCLHNEEPGCKAKSLPRYPSYFNILTSLLEATSQED